MNGKKKWYEKWWVILLLWPIFLMVWASRLIWRQKWEKKYRVGVIIALWGIVLIYGTISSNNSKQLIANQSVQSKWECIGPDGKKIGLSQKACEEFNNTWKNKPQGNKKEVINIPTVLPTNAQTTSVTSKNISVPSNTQIPQKDTSASKANNTDIYSILKKNASEKWGTDYEMVQYTYNNQVEAYNWVVAQTKYPEIMAEAKNKWGNDFEMVKYNYENQVDAYEWVNAQAEYPDIMTNAKQKWGDDYEMVKYEYENQVKAYKGL